MKIITNGYVTGVKPNLIQIFLVILVSMSACIAMNQSAIVILKTVLATTQIEQLFALGAKTSIFTYVVS